MLDQSFSAENFRKIFDLENRKGNYLEGELFEIVEINRKIKEKNEAIRTLRQKRLSSEDFFEQLEKIDEQKDELSEKKEELLMAKLNDISSSIVKKSFNLKILADTAITTKPVYKTERTLENILTLKQLQYNFRKLYKVKQANRYLIISQLKNLLDDGFPKTILRTDIKQFYENIPHENLLKKINDDNLLTHLSMKFIKQILQGFTDKTGISNGVPRGIGISPFFAELYMRQVDSKIKSLPNLMYYARYVDDMILIFMPSINEESIDYKKEVNKILFDEGLEMNEDDGKTQLINLFEREKDLKYSFDYLGYKFSSGYRSKRHLPLEVRMSSRKKKRYAKRLIDSFELYVKRSKMNEKQARKIFVKRIRFLTSNTRLVNNKKNVITGVYYSNSLVTTNVDFKLLDRFFQRTIKKYSLPLSLSNRIKLNSFEAGFNPSNIKIFKAKDIQTIKGHWTKCDHVKRNM